MRLATWNVNSALVRLPRLLPWLDERAPDVVCLQETKLSDEAWEKDLAAPLAERGYAVAHHGEGRWNGVALLSRVGLDDVVRGLPDEPRFPTAGRPGRGPRGHRDLRRAARHLGLRAQRPQPGGPALRLQAGVAGRPGGRRSAPRPRPWWPAT